eukprot:5562046-Pleurochrysis_carterae.AAC.1
MRCASSAVAIVANDGWPCAHCESSSALLPWRKRAGLSAMRRANPLGRTTEWARRRAARTEVWLRHSCADGRHA